MQAVVGDRVSVGVRDTGDEAVGAQSSQVVGHLTGAELVRRDAPQVGDDGADVLVGEAVGLQPKQRQGGQQGVTALFTQTQAGDAGTGGGDDRRGEGVQGIGARDRIMAD
ncbi:MAG: hypothetical protein ACSLE6_17335 [Mycobacterium sp.]